jgi:tellurite resistance protein TehA-like permease
MIKILVMFVLSVIAYSQYIVLPVLVEYNMLWTWLLFGYIVVSDVIIIIYFIYKFIISKINFHKIHEI